MTNTGGRKLILSRYNEMIWLIKIKAMKFGSFKKLTYPKEFGNLRIFDIDKFHIFHYN